MYKYKAYLISNKVAEQLFVGEWIEDLSIKEFKNSSDLIYCLKFATNFIVKTAIKKAPYIVTCYVISSEGEKIRVDFGKHYEFIDIYCEDIGDVL